MYAVLLYSHDWIPAILSSFTQAGIQAAGIQGLNPGEIFVESLALTRWMHQSSDPLPARLRRELGSKGIGLGPFAVADAFVRDIDEVIALVLGQSSGPFELVYDFSTGLSEDKGLVRSWRLLSAVEQQAFPRELAAARAVLSRVG